MRRMTWGSISSASDAAMSTFSRFAFYWPFSWRGLYAVTFGVLLAHWFWVLFAPHTIFTITVPERSIGLEAGQLFGIVASTATANQGIALPNVQLLGVFAASHGKTGFAVLMLDDKRQLGIAEGDEVVSGTRLVEVLTDHVILERAGARQRIDLENKYAEATNKTNASKYSAGTIYKQNSNGTEGSMQKQLHQLNK
jgi:Type II secretion system protein C